MFSSEVIATRGVYGYSQYASHSRDRCKGVVCTCYTSAMFINEFQTFQKSAVLAYAGTLKRSIGIVHNLVLSNDSPDEHVLSIGSNRKVPAHAPIFATQDYLIAQLNTLAADCDEVLAFLDSKLGEHHTPVSSKPWSLVEMTAIYKELGDKTERYKNQS